jgi:magnesium chelatase family protein
MAGAPTGDPSAVIAAKVEAAYQRQLARQGKSNQRLGTREIDEHCRLDRAGRAVLREVMERLHWSGRAYHRVLKVARSIADLAGESRIDHEHVKEAVQYRRALRDQ